MPSGDLPVTRKTWSKPGARPGHALPRQRRRPRLAGGPQFLPARVIGPVSRHLDATGLLLDMAERETASATGRPMLNLGDLA